MPGAAVAASRAPCAQRVGAVLPSSFPTTQHSESIAVSYAGHLPPRGRSFALGEKIEMELHQQNSGIAAAAVASSASADAATARRQLALLYRDLPTDNRRHVLENDRDEIFRRLRRDNRT